MDNSIAYAYSLMQEAYHDHRIGEEYNVSKGRILISVPFERGMRYAQKLRDAFAVLGVTASAVTASVAHRAYEYELTLTS